jgi:DNA-directed RNA polymerase specialized sigma24 family protein
VIRVSHVILPAGLSALARRGADGELSVYVSDTLDPDRQRAAVRAARREGWRTFLPVPSAVLLLAPGVSWLRRAARALRAHPVAWGTAPAVVLDSFAAMQHPSKPSHAADGGLSYLHRQVVARARRAVRHHRLAGGGQAPAPAGMPGRAGSPPQAPRFESDAVVRALRALPAGQREAIVLTLYLDLTDEQAAAAMRVSLTALRRYPAAARTALRVALPADS